MAFIKHTLKIYFEYVQNVMAHIIFGGAYNGVMGHRELLCI